MNISLENIRIGKLLGVVYAIYIVCAFSFVAAHSHNVEHHQLGIPHDCVMCDTSVDLDEGYIPEQIIISGFGGSPMIEPLLSDHEITFTLIDLQARAPPRGAASVT